MRFALLAGTSIETLEPRTLLASYVNTVMDGLGRMTPVDPDLRDVVGAELAYLHQDYVAWTERTRGIATLADPLGPAFSSDAYIVPKTVPNFEMLLFDSNNVVIDATAVEGQAEALAVELIAVGARITGSYRSMVSAWLPIAAIELLPSMSHLAYVSPAHATFTNSNSVVDQAIVSMKSDVASVRYGVDGSGVTIGIISDSIGTDSISYARDVASGDIPPDVLIMSDPPATDEGRAMAQLVHDIAPGASLAFHGSPGGSAAFASHILDLAKPRAQGGAGAQVVVDDLWTHEPFFQDGIIAQAVDEAVTQYGISYFSSAGNDSRNAYEAPFRSKSIATPSWAQASLGSTSTWHDFDPGPGLNIYQPIELSPGERLSLYLQWDSPAVSVSGGLGCRNDLDVYVLDATQSTLLAESSRRNVGGDPAEIVSYTNQSNTPIIVQLAINHYFGQVPGKLKYLDYHNGGKSNPLAYGTFTGASSGHAVARNAAGVGAARYDQTPAYGVFPAILEPFSSAGGTPILFDTSGNRLATPEYRQQPRFVAPDNTNTTFFGTDVDNDSLPNFSGTSAAAPHAAAVAALMKSLAPNLTASQIYSILQSTASDMATSGFDYDTGWGFINADKALAAVANISISGRVFQDDNQNRTFDRNERIFGGLTVFLDTDADGVLDAGSLTQASLDVPKAIPDALFTGQRTRVASTMIVSGLPGRVTDLNVRLTIRHEWDADLTVYLISPSGIRTELFSAVGGAGDNFVDTTFDDQAAKGIATGTAPFTGEFKPRSSLAAMIGEDPNGYWTLEAKDNRFLGSGEILSWSLVLSYAERSTISNNQGQYSFVNLPESTYFGAFRPKLSMPQNYRLIAPAAPYSFSFGAGQSTSSASFGIIPTPAPLLSVTIDDGSAQRSMVRKIRIRIGGQVELAGIQPNAFTLSRTTGTPFSISLMPVALIRSATWTEFDLTFTGMGLLNGSLEDGRYRLDIDGSKIKDLRGISINVGGNRSSNGFRSIAFHRLFGDSDGNAFVDGHDESRFRTAFLSGIVTLENSIFDYDGDGFFTAADSRAFEANLFRRL